VYKTKSHHLHCTSISCIAKQHSYTFADGACDACSNLISDDDLKLVDELENDDDTVAVNNKLI